MPHREDQDSLGQAHAHRAEQMLDRMFPFRIEVEHEPLGMDSAVGPAAAVNLDGLFEDHVEATLDVILYGITSDLTLPAEEIRSVECNQTLPTHSQYFKAVPPSW